MAVRQPSTLCPFVGRHIEHPGREGLFLEEPDPKTVKFRVLGMFLGFTAY